MEEFLNQEIQTHYHNNEDKKDAIILLLFLCRNKASPFRFVEWAEIGPKEVGSKQNAVGNQLKDHEHRSMFSPSFLYDDVDTQRVE